MKGERASSAWTKSDPPKCAVTVVMKIPRIRDVYRHRFRNEYVFISVSLAMSESAQFTSLNMLIANELKGRGRLFSMNL